MKSNLLHLIIISLISRIFYISLAFFSYYFFPSFDKSSYHFLQNWDNVFFTSIQNNCYTSEHQLAFFPLLPLVSNFFKHFGLSYIFFINTIFIINSILLYKISYKIEEEISRTVFYFFIFNPSSIILSSFYTETLFMLLFLLLILRFLEKKYIQCTFLISLLCLCRSNGILFCLFLKHKIIYFFMSLSLISIFQVYCLSKMSINIISNFKIPYSYIQKKYWNQGFFKFYTFNNISNILISLPFIIFNLFCFLKINCSQTLLKNLKILLIIQTILSILFLHLNMYFRFISYNPLVYIFMAHMYKYNKNFLFKIYCRYYLAFSVAYAVLYGAFYPPA